MVCIVVVRVVVLIVCCLFIYEFSFILLYQPCPRYFASLQSVNKKVCPRHMTASCSVAVTLRIPVMRASRG